MNASLDDLHLFLRIVETGSLRAAAADLRTDPSNVSRRLTQLEKRLGVRLIKRSRVRSVPTDAGHAYYQRLKELLQQIAALEQDIAGTADEPRGVLRVAAPIDFGAIYIGPWLRELTARAPRLSVELMLSDAYVDLNAQGIDVAIRIGKLQDSAAIARHLGVMPMAIVGSPNYLEQRGIPAAPEELTAHDFVLFSDLQAGAELALTHRDGRVHRVQCASRFAVNHLGGAGRVVEAGGGLHAGPLWYFAQAIAAGRLCRVLEAWSPPSYPLHALYQPSPYMAAKVRHFVDFVAERAAQTPGVERR